MFVQRQRSCDTAAECLVEDKVQRMDSVQFVAGYFSVTDFRGSILLRVLLLLFLSAFHNCSHHMGSPKYWRFRLCHPFLHVQFLLISYFFLSCPSLLSVDCGKWFSRHVPAISSFYNNPSSSPADRKIRGIDQTSKYRISCVMSSRGTKIEQTETTSDTRFTAPPPPAGPLV